MALALDYPDAYLARFCTDEREARAFAEVDAIEPFTLDWTDAAAKALWRDQCARAKCYVIACLENQAAPDDLFTVKLKAYRAEFDSLLARAQAAVPNPSGALVFSVPLERA